MTTLPGGRLPRPRPWQRNLTLGFLGTTIVAGWAANAVFATLVDRHPLVLIAMNSTPVRPLPIMVLMALPPPPPTPR